MPFFVNTFQQLNLIKCKFHAEGVLIIPNLYIVCLATTGNLRFCALISVGALFLYADGGCMNKNIQKRPKDITGIELTPGEPSVCRGNGEQGYECCCDECDYFLLCFPESDPKNKEENPE